MSYTSLTEVVPDRLYLAADGRQISRESNTRAPNGVPVNGCWVLRDSVGIFIDFDKYFNDLAERHHLTL